MARLSQLLHLSRQPLIALVGAGGKTTTMYGLAHELVTQGRRVVTTTTTNIYLPQPDESEYLIVEREIKRLLPALATGWHGSQHITVAREMTENGKLKGLQPEQPLLCLQRGGAEVVIVEADGARHRRIKAPASHEPVLPLQTNLVLVLFSAEVLNAPLTAELAHRPEIIARLTGIEQGDPLTPAVVARLLLHEEGGRKDVPVGADVYVLVTHATKDQRQAIAELAALLRREPRITGLCYAEQPGAWFAA